MKYINDLLLSYPKSPATYKQIERFIYQYPDLFKKYLGKVTLGLDDYRLWSIVTNHVYVDLHILMKILRDKNNAINFNTIILIIDRNSYSAPDISCIVYYILLIYDEYITDEFLSHLYKYNLILQNYAANILLRLYIQSPTNYKIIRFLFISGVNPNNHSDIFDLISKKNHKALIKLFLAYGYNQLPGNTGVTNN